MAAPTITWQGHERFFGFVAEPNDPPLPGAAGVPNGPAITAYQVAGYTNSPGFTRTRQAIAIEGVPSYRNVDARQMANYITYRSELTLCATDQTLTLLDAATRSATGWTKTCLGLPLISVVSGSVSDNGAGRFESQIGRHALINSCNFSFQEGQPVKATIEAFAHYLQSGDAISSSTLGLTTLHDALTWNTVEISIGGEPWRHAISSVEVGINNNIKRNGYRSLSSPAALQLTPETMQPGKEEISLSFKFHTGIPEDMLDGEIGQIVLTAYGYSGTTKKVLTITIDHAVLNEGGADPAGAGDTVSYNASFEARGISVAWTSVAPPDPTP